MMIDLSRREIDLLLDALDIAYEDACENADEGLAARYAELADALRERRDT